VWNKVSSLTHKIQFLFGAPFTFLTDWFFVHLCLCHEISCVAEILEVTSFATKPQIAPISSVVYIREALQPGSF